MHLLAAQPGGFVDEEGIIDLQQTPGDIVILSAADDTLALLAKIADTLPDNFPQIRLANFLNLNKPAAFDLYRDQIIDQASVVLLYLLGGESYWQYGLEQLQEWAQANNQQPNNRQRTLIVVPGEDQPDDTLMAKSSVPFDAAYRVWRYLREGTEHNAEQLFNFINATYFHQPIHWLEPKALPRVQIYHPQQYAATLADWQRDWVTGQPVGLLLFYRNHLQTGNTKVFDEFIVQLQQTGINPLPLAVASLKENLCLEMINHLAQETGASVILNSTGFAAQSGQLLNGVSAIPTDIPPIFSVDVPVIQVIMSSSNLADWQQNAAGLRPRDIAMHIALPELDGRIISRAISFKAAKSYNQRCQIDVIQYQLHTERAQFVAQLAYRWSQLKHKSNAQKRLGLILANYPTRDGRIGNGVGLDTPASTINILQRLQTAGYVLGDDLPLDGNDLITRLQAAVTNNLDTLDQRPCWQSITVAEYRNYFQQLPESNQQAVLNRWGPPENDIKFREGRIMIAGIRLGENFVGIQPARGFNIDINANYHDPDLVPPHSYLAFYFWLRFCYQVDAMMHIGKHGNLEWLPGKGTALSNECWPDAVFGPTPQLYPFIVNDPGEGAQAKRRTQAVIIDHLMPPMTRAEIYGDLADLEELVDEYYQALGMDQQRQKHLQQAIVNKAKKSNILQEITQAVPRPCADLTTEKSDETLVEQLDTYLCEIKESQIRDGLHIFGQLPAQQQLRDTLLALVRIPRGNGPTDKSILTTLCEDFQLLDFDPLNPQGGRWTGQRPAELQALSTSVWHTDYHTRERLELFAQQILDQLLNNSEAITTALPATTTLLNYVIAVLLPALQTSCRNELDHVIKGLAGGFIPPGPSGAPTRGRLDTLPTGRNFYSVDNRAIPSKTAWELGQKSAERLIMRHLQEHGDYPKQIGLSVWGTATMRTGGDDIAQAFALMGIKPVWAPGSQRVIDFEILPAFLLNRPRVDVTLRVSGFFRDAFPNVIHIYDAAVRKLAEFDEPGFTNTIQQHIETKTTALIAQGVDPDQAKHQAGYRVFGSKPGAYGAGLQGLIDERCWETPEDLARAYINWGGYAYGQQDQGTAAHQAFTDRLSELDVVLQNQDNREHDIFDSDDYYQFQGGMTNAVRTLSGTQPTVYHADHSNPDNPKIKTLKEEINRVMRSRVLNPKWIHAMQRHGYKGAFEMAATVDYLFAYDATTGMIDDYQYEQVTDALLRDPDNQQFMRDNNIAALQEMAERLLEAIQRGMWDAPQEYQELIEETLLSAEAGQESTL